MVADYLNDRRPLTCLVPDGRGPIEVYDDIAAVRMAVIDRSDVGLLRDMGWDTPGIYILLAPKEGEWTAYVGKAPSGVRTRVAQHNKAKEFWSRAVLVQRDNTNGFTSAHTAWLEGRMYQLLSASLGISLENKQVPGDNTLAPHELHMLESIVAPISRLLNLVGCRVLEDMTNGNVPNEKSKGWTDHGVTTKMLLESGSLHQGESLKSTRASVPATAILDSEGNVLWNGQTHTTLSSAASAVRGGKAMNGWDFWGVERNGIVVPLTEVRSHFLVNR